jgi:hypothetical protein
MFFTAFKHKWHIGMDFNWREFRVGVYYNKLFHIVYFQPLPMLIIRLQFIQ